MFYQNDHNGDKSGNSKENYKMQYAQVASLANMGQDLYLQLTIPQGTRKNLPLLSS